MQSELSSPSPNDSIAGELLPWDSEFFGVKVGRLRAHRLTVGTLHTVEDWCQANNLDCVYFLADADDPETARLAQSHNFRMVDIRVTLARKLNAPEPAPASGNIRQAVTGDLPQLRAIAGTSHEDSRFYFDGAFPREKCRLLYQTWISKSLQGYADIVLVAEHNGEAAGYISCKRRGAKTGEIGLLAVGSQAQGLGLGRQLVIGALHWFRNHGIELVEVVTQGRNVRAQKCYQRCGFLTHSVQIWYHRWFR